MTIGRVFGDDRMPEAAEKDHEVLMASYLVQEGKWVRGCLGELSAIKTMERMATGPRHRSLLHCNGGANLRDRNCFLARIATLLSSSVTT